MKILSPVFEDESSISTVDPNLYENINQKCSDDISKFKIGKKNRGLFMKSYKILNKVLVKTMNDKYNISWSSIINYF